MADAHFELTVPHDGVISLPPEVGERAGLATGDILSLELVTDECLALKSYRELLGAWDAMDRWNLLRFIMELLNRPLTAVEPGALSIPAEIFPLAAGGRVLLQIFDHFGGRQHELWLSRR